MKRARAIAVAIVLAALIAGTAGAQMGQGPRGPVEPGQMPGQMGMMMQMMTQMQEQMREMQAQMRGMQGVGPMPGRMSGQQLCPGAMGTPAPKQ